MVEERRRAVVTGAASGIGRAAAKRLIAEGFEVVVADVNAAALERTVADMSAEPGRALPCILDVSSATDCERLADDFGRVDVLVANAGIQSSGSLLETDDETWEAVLAVNLKGVANCCRAVLPGMVQREGGAIVVVSSNNAVCGSAGMAAYDASKAGVLALVRSVAIEHGSDRVRINAVSPGTTITDYHIQRFAEKGVSESELYDMTSGTGLLNRAAKPDEIASAIWFLASDEASYITGANLMVDGGFSLAGGH